MATVTIAYTFDVVDAELLHARARELDGDLYTSLPDVDDETAFGVVLDDVGSDHMDATTHGVTMREVVTVDQ